MVSVETIASLFIKGLKLVCIETLQPIKKGHKNNIRNNNNKLSEKCLLMMLLLLTSLLFGISRPPNFKETLSY